MRSRDLKELFAINVWHVTKGTFNHSSILYKKTFSLLRYEELIFKIVRKLFSGHLDWFTFIIFDAANWYNVREYTKKCVYIYFFPDDISYERKKNYYI